ncbi:aromatic prenyltransferase [Nocardia sp. BMG51109]|uniref:aromatic prenyltransferase n=1 Tax=Nocardia sp. BMG51109 TaxID=1056816 RepID=UPI00046707F3|nr:aromatic prenyltransferase [Nocardia sp. BMG51109]
MTAAATLDRLRDDLREYARLSEAHYEPSRVEPVLDVLGEMAPDALISVRTTTEPVGEREVNVRFVHLPDDADPVARFRDAGLLSFSKHPMEQALAAVADSVPVQYGVDVAVGTGIQKIWLSFPQLMSLRDMLAFPGIPDSARAHAEHLARWGGDHLALAAFDFVSHTMNLYSQLLMPGQLAPEDISTILAELDFVPATGEELAALGSHAYTIYRTFSWSAPDVQRICFPRRFTPENFPVHLDPLLERFVREAPLAGGGEHAFTFYVAYGPRGRYYKVQADYNPRGSDVRLPGNAAVPPSH